MNQIKTNPKETILVISTALLILYIIFENDWYLYTSLTISVLGILFSFFAEKVNFVWMKITYVLSLIFPKIILGSIFYLFLFPIASLSKLFKRDSLNLKNNNDSVYKSVNKEFEKKSFENTW